MIPNNENIDWARLKYFILNLINDPKDDGSQYLDDDFRCQILSNRYNTANRLLLITSGAKQFIVKIADLNTYSGRRLDAEISWYRYIARENKGVFSHIPQVIGSFSSHKQIILVLEYIQNAITLRHGLITSQIDPHYAIDLLQNILGLFDIRIGIYSNKELELMNKNVYQRLVVRTNLLKKLSPLEWHTPIMVNELAPISLEEITASLKKISVELIHPRISVIGETHGDLHFENILVSQNSGFSLIDPNAKIGSIPIYDLGKLAQSTHGLYDLIHSGNSTISILSPSRISLSFTTEANVQYQFLDHEFINLLKFIATREDVFFELYKQVKLMCLSHFLCLLPHHYSNPYKYKALVARTILLFHEVREEMSQTLNS